MLFPTPSDYLREGLAQRRAIDLSLSFSDSLCYHTAIMSKERQDHPPLPPKEASEEMLLGSALRYLVDDLFTCQTVAEKLQGINAGDALPALVETWKRGLTQHLEETVHRSVDSVVSLLDLLQSGDTTTPLNQTELQEWERVVGWYKPFEVASICREDLQEVVPGEMIANLTDEQMQQIANKMSDKYSDGSYWVNLSDAVQQVLNPPTPPGNET